jgi:hypothetical protein
VASGSGSELEPRFDGEEMNAMSRIPYRRIFVIAALLALVIVPLAGARTLEPRSVDTVQDGGWIGATLRWVEDLVGLRRPGHRPGQSGPQALPNTKSGDSTSIGGTCIDPMGRPKPCF